MHVRSALGVQQPILTRLARRQAVGTSDTTVPANGYQLFPIRQGDNTTAFVACQSLAESYVHTDPVGSPAACPGGTGNHP